MVPLAHGVIKTSFLTKKTKSMTNAYKNRSIIREYIYFKTLLKLKFYKDGNYFFILNVCDWFYAKNVSYFSFILNNIHYYHHFLNEETSGQRI